MYSIERQKRKEFRRLLKNLADQKSFKDNDKKEKFILDLRKLYIKNDNIIFQHFYSDIFPILTDLKEKHKSLDVVGQNLKILYDSIENDDILKQPVKKLLDHTNLEIARISYVFSIDARMGMTGQELREKYDEISKIASEIEPKVEDLAKKANSSYSEFISILGIFSAVVLVYFGGTTILGNVLTTMNETFVLKSIAISLIVGIIVLNIIFVFIYFLSKILGRSIASIDEDENWYPNIIEKTKEKYPIMYYVNIFFIMILFLDVFVWLLYLLNKHFDFVQIIIFYISNENIYCRIISLIFFSLCIIDIIFIIYYTFCKLMNITTGNYIQLSYSSSLYVYRDKGNACWNVINNYGDEKQIKCLIKVIPYYILEVKDKIFTKMINLKRRLFNRYPRIIWFNLLAVSSIIIIYKFFVK